MKKAIIVEDEINGLNNLKSMLADNCPDVQVIGDAGDIASGLKLLASPPEKIDVAFLDINLPDGLVFQLLNQLKEVNFDIIFVTAYEEYAIKACNYSSIGFVLKPIDPDLLKEAVGRIQPTNAKVKGRLGVFHSYYNNPNAFSKLSISALDGIYFVNLQDIIRLEAEDNYTHIFLKEGKKITASKTIKSYEELLEPYNFHRVHKRHVINLNFMKKFVRGDGGYLIMDDAMQIEVSRRRRSVFMEKIKNLQ